MTETISWNDFMKVSLCAGTITKAEVFAEAKKPAYKLWVDFGDEIGIKKSSAQITGNYKPEDLIGRQVLCVINFPPKQVGPFISEFLTTGMEDADGNITLLSPDHPVKNGTRLL